MEQKIKNSFRKIVNFFKSPYVLMVIAILFLIFVGAALLQSRMCTAEGQERLDFIDAMFMATTSVCVTGLSVVDNIGLQFNIAGKVVIIFLVFFGGLGMITIVDTILLLVKKINGKELMVTTKGILKEVLNENDEKSTLKTLGKFVWIATIIQVVGGIVFLFIFRFHNNMQWKDALLTGFSIRFLLLIMPEWIFLAQQII